MGNRANRDTSNVPDDDQDLDIIGDGPGGGDPGGNGHASPEAVQQTTVRAAKRSERGNTRPNRNLPGDPAEIAERLLDTDLSDWGAPDDPLWESHPFFAAFLFKKSWNGIDPREPAAVTISVRPTGLQFSVKLPSEGQSCGERVRHWGDLLDMLEACLRNHTGDWKELKNGPGATLKREARKKERDIRKSRK
jgi:hypothetical protein